MTAPLVVGFDLDMTLFDTRPAIGATLAAVAADLGVEFDVELFLSELGPPLDVMVGQQLPKSQVAAFVDRYRDIYHLHGLPAAKLLSGARESIDAVADHQGQSIVITGKNLRDATAHIETEKLPVAAVIGWAWAEGKTVAMREHGAGVYVGDHPADIAAARAAGAAAVAVTTGSHGADSFADADVVLDSLTEFPPWLARHVAAA
ncbi:phosphoglycolate phosphatase [Stackebrandtia endophytica]|uniref:Phosphoglycolate phosphatase n=1 Tax=Stackebrandtia endophytica TaxID=1496996 RepID=A0A543AWB4_9ACTN|nr:HAD hydrolase-like protein [Stackebrandtia endophytica]TQL76861.1 phosphoglycolate phosphatase [Stackebrandtia endophytica]